MINFVAAIYEVFTISKVKIALVGLPIVYYAIIPLNKNGTE